MNIDSHIPIIRTLPTLEPLQIEQGSWVPSYVATTNDFDSITYSIREGTYFRIANFVFVTFYLETSSLTIGTAAGQCEIRTLPFQNEIETKGSGVVSECGAWNNDPSQCVVEPNTSRIELMYRSASNGPTSQLGVTDMLTAANSNLIVGSASYFLK